MNTQWPHSVHSQEDVTWHTTLITHPGWASQPTCTQWANQLQCRNELFLLSTECLPSLSLQSTCPALQPQLSIFFPVEVSANTSTWYFFHEFKEHGKWQRSGRIYFFQSWWPISCLPLTVISELWGLRSCSLVIDTLFIFHFTVFVNTRSPTPLPLMLLFWIACDRGQDKRYVSANWQLWANLSGVHSGENGYFSTPPFILMLPNEIMENTKSTMLMLRHKHCG